MTVMFNINIDLIMVLLSKLPASLWRPLEAVWRLTIFELEFHGDFFYGSNLSVLLGDSHPVVRSTFHTGPDIVPEANKSPGLIMQPFPA